ncbi:MAG: hypothetical protein H8E98_07745 [Bacteroidetes bacterium]|nr:hypothetical protein [Bacteroidota bacterium]
MKIIIRRKYIHKAIIIAFLIIASLFAQSSVAIIEFKGNNISLSVTSALTDRLRTELEEIKIYKLIEREMMDEVLSEHGFQMSGCTSNECIVEMGQLISAELIIVGSISKVGKTYTVSSRLIDVETGLITNTATYDHTGEIDIVLKSGMKIIAHELAGKKLINRSNTIAHTPIGNSGEKKSFARLIFPYSLGIETFALPYKTIGDSYSIWFGKGNIRLKYAQSTVMIPEVYNRDGFEKDEALIKSISIDYIFNSYDLKGFWIGSGLMSFDGSIGHENELERGNYQSIRLSANSGYIYKLIHNVSVNIWGGLSVMIMGDEEIQVGGQTAYRDLVNPIVTIDIGWHI